jgi:hypothetical protein
MLSLPQVVILHFVFTLNFGNMFKDYFINKWWTTKAKYYHKGAGHFDWVLYRRILKAKSESIPN